MDNFSSLPNFWIENFCDNMNTTKYSLTLLLERGQKAIRAFIEHFKNANISQFIISKSSLQWMQI